MSFHVSDSHVYQDRSERAPRVPSNRFTNLINDVFTKFKVELQPETLTRGSQFSYMELCSDALHERPITADTEVIIFASSSLEFDPKQPGVGAAFMNRFGVFDLHAISNEGILGGFTALHLASKMVKQENRKVCLIAIEQNTNPLPVGYDGFVPTENIVGMLDLRAGENAGTPNILASGVVHKAGLRKKLDELTRLHGLTKETLRLHVKDEGTFADFLSEPLRGCETQVHDSAISSIQFIQYLRGIEARKSRFNLLLIEDVFSKNCGYALLEESNV